MYNRSIEQVFHIFYRIYTMSMPKIVIVGAGVSGIAAATRLIENGYTDITILEAENRIGGRVNSVEFGGSMIDVGAQWVHGEKGNCVYEMVKDLNLLETSFNNYQDNTYYLSNGKPLDKRITDALFIIAMSVINDEDEAKLHPGTFGEYFKEVYYQRIKNEFENDSDILSLAKIFEEWTEKFFRCVDSTETWYDVSNIGPFAIQKCEGDQLLNWKNKGYRTIFYVLMKKFPDIIKHLTIDDKIHLNKEVTKIVWDNNDSYKDGATVTCSDGSSYNADHVIITVSVGVLKIIYKNVFIPELPAFKTNAIEGITLGTIDKIFIKFPAKWWPDDLKGFSLLWTEEDKHKLRKDFPHGPNVDGRSWLEDVFGFYVIDSHPNILLGWVVGKMARDVELLPDNVVIQGCMFLLRQFVGKKYKISEPDGILRSKWATNPHFCGTYSHVSLEAEKRNAKAEDLAKSVTNCNNKQTLIFAGEASHPTLFSTVHGAIETGYRAAHSIISIYKGACARSLCYVSRTSNATSPINNHFHSTGAAFHRTHTMSRPKIVIVGAGASGIAAATRLIGKGFTDVTILEAENRIGGRVNSVEFGGSIVDIGAQWVHGEKGNCVYEMVKGMDLLQTSLNNYQDNTYYLSNGKPVDKSITDRLFRTTMSVINDEDEAKLHPGTFGKYFMEVYNQRVKKEFGNDADILNLAKIFEEWSEKFFLCLDSTKSWHDVSNIGPFVFQSCEGDQQLNWKNRGYRTILYIMMKKFPDFTEQLAIDDKIHLNKEVTKIVWDNNDSYKDGATVICSDGSSYNADHVIVTVSVGVLKSIYKKAFIPELPAFKTNAIEGITLGTVNKILLKFPTKWWPDDLKGFSLLWTEEDKRKLRTDFPHGPNVDGRSWLEDVFGFYVIDSHPRVLLGWVVGKMAKDVESLPDSVVMQGCTLLLKQFVGRKYKVPEPDGVLRSKWGSNPHFCGSYTHVSMEAEKRNAKAEDLAKSVTNRNNKQILLFAGEASHPTRFSTVDGAIETGHRAADSIISMHKNPKVHYKIGIIGAGMAGLGAAIQLQNSNIDDFILLEAQNEPGGRIKTIQVNNKPLDLGAQWLHGKHNPLYTLLEKHNMISSELSEEGLGLFVRNDGKIFDEFLVKRVDFEVGTILEECQKFVKSSDYPESIQDYLQYRFKQYLSQCDDSEEVRAMKLQLLDWHIRFQIIDNSCRNLHRLSAKYWGLYECLDDVAHYNPTYGYKPMVDVLVDELPNGKIRCNTEVAKIEYDNKVTLTCADGEQVSCDHLILTVSLGVLKQFKEIHPPLPNNLTTAIDNMGFDTIGKVFLFFEYKWWNHDGIQFIWNGDEEFEDDEKWLRTMTGFDPVFNHDNALLGWVGSEGVGKMESLSEEEVGWSCVNLLRKFLPDYDIPNPIAVIRTQWNSNPWVRGSYCHITPECDDSNSGIEQMTEPVAVDGIPRILLAGEAVHPNHYSTVHGAYESGQNQAAFLVEYLSASDDYLD